MMSLKNNKKHENNTHAELLHNYIATLRNKLSVKQAPLISPIKSSLNSHTHLTHSHKPPLLMSYLNKTAPSPHPSRACP